MRIQPLLYTIFLAPNASLIYNLCPLMKSLIQKQKTWLALVVVCLLVFLVNGPSNTLKTESLSLTPTPSRLPTIIQQVKDGQTTPTLVVTTSSAPSGTTATVIKVIDGDTIEVSGGEKIRYIGIDTPETVDPRRPVMCFGKQASDENKKLVEGKTVVLVKDVSETDKYGRLLRYVYLPDGTFINELLVKEGYARATSYPPDVKYQELFRSAEQQARDAQIGLWGSCSITPTPALQDLHSAGQAATPLPFVAPATASTGDKDCKDFTTHVQAQAYFESKGGSKTNNVDNLDSDHDGVACESLP